MAKKVKCPKCEKKIEVRSVPWGLILKFHTIKVMDGEYECPGSGELVKDDD